ncbi:MAG: hypothetical protein ABW352_24765 [Polyangiales bacterium]
MMRAIVLALMLVACSASEDANRGIRCDSDTPCPGALFCYRNFCIPHDVPHEVLEAGVATPFPEAGAAVDATIDLMPVDAALVPPALEDASTVPPTVADAATAELDAETPLPEPEVDSGAPAMMDDAGRASSAALLVCAPSCSNRSPACLRCLSSVLSSNPTICSGADAEAEPVVAGLCEYLCTNAACKAEP